MASKSVAEGKHDLGSGLPSKAWLSNGVELLFQREGLNRHGKPFDVVVIGSGYGGAIAAAELSKASGLNLSICLLERGREFLPGSFPSSMNEAPTEFRVSSGNKPKGNLEGLFDLRINKDLNVMQANGLGGGSLINAGVMARAHDHVFDNDLWPKELCAETLAPYYSDAEQILGASIRTDDGTNVGNTILLHEKYAGDKSGPSKYQSLKQLSQATDKANFKATNITISMKEGLRTSAGHKMSACSLCGDCASGCNTNAKISLDKNLLIEAARNGVEIFTGASAIKLAQNDQEQWITEVVYTDSQLRSRQAQTELKLRSNNVILSAGALGSTEILQRSRSQVLRFSSQLGQQFSSNGDMMVVGFKQKAESNAVVDPNSRLSDRDVGPTITGMIDLRDNPNESARVVIQEMAVPGAAAHFFSELYATVGSIHSLWNSDKTTHKPGSDFVDPAALNQNDIRHTSLYAIMGNDGAKGALRLDSDDSDLHEGTIQIDWPALKHHEIFEHQIKHLEYLSNNGEVKLGGDMLVNPAWQILKPEHMQMMNVDRGAPLTVHPLGGCAMGNSDTDGVTNHLGQVFKPSTDFAKEAQCHPGLFVLDGSIIPEAVGINPALTISAVSLRAIRHIIKQGVLKQSNTATPNQAEISNCKDFEQAPIIRSVEQLEQLAVEQQRDTEVQITERLNGFSRLEDDSGVEQDVVIELSLWSKPVKLKQLSKTENAGKPSQARVSIDSEVCDPVSQLALSKIRIYLRRDWDEIRAGKFSIDKHELSLDSAAKFIGRIEGNLYAFSRAESYPLSRIIESGWGWFLNRGLRDIYQVRRPKPWDASKTHAQNQNINPAKSGPFNRLKNLLRALTRAGEIRTMNYDITVCETLKNENFGYFGPSHRSNAKEQDLKKIIGIKRLTYERRANPWLQLAEVYLQELPSKSGKSLHEKLSRSNDRTRLEKLERGMAKQQDVLMKKGNKLSLDMNYLARIGIPLVRIAKQENQLKALMDLSSFGAYVTRMLLGVHFYSFRAPDSPQPREPVRLAGEQSGLPKPEIKRLIVGEIPDNTISSLTAGSPVEIVLTHYQANTQSNSKPPVMMIHGYSGSSAFFAHKSTPNSLTKVLLDEGRDIWLLDLRTSAALASARYPWSFESVADVDIPKALEFVYQHYQARQKIDLITHCMGSIMLGMSILKPSKTAQELDTSFFRKRVNRIIFSQATPSIVFTQDNNFRSFVTNYLKEMVPEDYQFQVKEGEKASQVLDRILYTLPYPQSEFDLTNAPLRPSRRAEFARTRHRVDAFFSRTFELSNLSNETLAHIDDFFGPIHVDTIVQASRFANHNVATNARGGNSYVSRERLQECWQGIPTMSFHSRNNGLVDYSTGARTKRIFDEAGLDYHCVVIDKAQYGHQDSLIGYRAHLDVFPYIINFLNKPSEQEKAEERDQLQASDQGWCLSAPSYGPVLIEPTYPKRVGSDKFKVMLGSSPAKASRPFCIFLPMVVVDGRLRLAPVPEQSLSSIVAQSLDLRERSSSEPNSRWNIFELPSNILNLYKAALNNDQQSKLASLMIYDDLCELDCQPVIGPTGDTTQAENHLGRPFTNHQTQELASILSSVIERFLQSNQNVAYEFEKSFIEIATRSEDTSPLSFALGSCQYPAGMLDKQVAYRSYQKLANVLDSNDGLKPEFIALVGDQIYADATAGLLDPTTKFDRFVLPYYRLFENEHVRRVLRKLPLYAMLDDHELVDNWEPVSNNPERRRELDETLSIGVKSFLKFQRGERLKDRNTELKDRALELWYHFEKKGHAFFVADTRTERRARTAENINRDTTRIMSQTQENALENWLKEQAKNSDNAKFLLSSSLFLPRHKMLHGSQGSAANRIRSDGWDGYPASLHKVLAQVVDNNVQNLVFLSGDEHQACFASISIHNLTNGTKVKANSLHCPGLYTPFPFANGRVDDFEGDTTVDIKNVNSQFDFSLGDNDYRCEMISNFDPKALPLSMGRVSVDKCGGFLTIHTH